MLVMARGKAVLAPRLLKFKIQKICGLISREPIRIGPQVGNSLVTYGSA
jgi:hypothetical protein